MTLVFTKLKTTRQTPFILKQIFIAFVIWTHSTQRFFSLHISLKMCSISASAKSQLGTRLYAELCVAAAALVFNYSTTKVHRRKFVRIHQVWPHTENPQYGKHILYMMKAETAAAKGQHNMSAECLIKSGIVASFFYFFYLVGWQKKIYLCVFIECEIYHLTLNMYYYKNIYAKSLQKHNNFLPYNLYVPWPFPISPMVRTRSHHNSIIIDGFARFMRSRPNLEICVFELFYI